VGAVIALKKTLTAMVLVVVTESALVTMAEMAKRHRGKELLPDKDEDAPKGNTRDKGKCKKRHKGRFNNAMVKTLTRKDRHRHHDEQLFYSGHKPEHRLFKCPMLQTKSTDNADKQD
jgi:hypothetical protein